MSSVTLSIAALLTSINAAPQDVAVADRVDLIEVNHYYDPQGRLVFDQVIFYDWSSRDSRFHVRAWRLLKSPWQIPRRSWTDGTYTTSWKDGEVIRDVKADMVRETWTQYDPELVERDYLPRERRRGLSKMVAKKP
ncbi:MAG: hypothetical protein ACKVH8_00465 [Pirellulales bacterium]